MGKKINNNFQKLTKSYYWRYLTISISWTVSLTVPLSTNFDSLKLKLYQLSYYFHNNLQIFNNYGFGELYILFTFEIELLDGYQSIKSTTPSYKTTTITIESQATQNSQNMSFLLSNALIIDVTNQTVTNALINSKAQITTVENQIRTNIINQLTSAVCKLSQY